MEQFVIEKMEQFVGDTSEVFISVSDEVKEDNIEENDRACEGTSDCNIVGVNNNQHDKYSYTVFDICISESSDEDGSGDDDISSLSIWRIPKRRKKSNSSSNDDGNKNVVHEDESSTSPPLQPHNLQVSFISPSINLYVIIIITWYFCCRLMK